MTKNYFFLLFLFIFIKINAQSINFNSSNFKARLLLASTDNNIAKGDKGISIKIDENGDNEIQLSEALKVTELDISFVPIQDITGIEYFTNLKKLLCPKTQISALNIDTLKELTYLDCSNNLLVTFDASALVNLENLICGSCKLTSINLKNLNKLQNLYVEKNSLTTMDLSDLIDVKGIQCMENSLKKLDLKGLVKLNTLVCNNNQIESLDNITDCPDMYILWTENNKLTKLDFSKSPLLFLIRADNNKLESVDLTGLLSLNSATFANNLITSLGLKGNCSANFIKLSDNDLSTLDLSGFVGLGDFECKNNKNLKTIFAKNGMDENIDIEGCTNVIYICNDVIKDSNIEKYIASNKLNNIHLNSYCTFEPGGIFYTINGNTTVDVDKNGCDENDVKYPGLNFSITDNVTKTNFISNTSGNYRLSVGEGAYKITPILENPSYYKISPEIVNLTFPNQNSQFVQNFCITPNGTHHDLEISILPTLSARPGFDTEYKLIYKNKGNQVRSGKITLDFNDAVLDLVSVTPAITTQGLNKLNWDYVDLKPFETREIIFTMNVNSPMETPAVNIGDRLSFNALITPVADDEKPVDNSFALRQIVVGSFDPNDKTCLEGDVIKSELIGEYVHYMIRFENTGTYPAENIVVKDMIDLSKFDISTLVPTSASHSYTTKISDGNKVEFIFEKINLPFNDADNDGYIAFKIKTLPTLVVGDSFNNEANIYFDYNFPILTNKATSTYKILGTQDFEFSNYVTIYPVPAKDILNINLKNNIQIKSMSVYDVLGQLIIAAPNAETASNLDISRLKTGNYFLKITSDKGSSSIKFNKI